LAGFQCGADPAAGCGRENLIQHLPAAAVLFVDPGLVQLRVASGKVLSLGMSLAVLYGFTKLAGQPFTVALLSVLIPMIASMAPLQQLLTAGLILAVTGTAVTLGAWLVSDKVAGDVVIVVIIVATTFAQRFSSRAANLGLAGFMTYLVVRSAGATFAQLRRVGYFDSVAAAGSLSKRYVAGHRESGAPEPDVASDETATDGQPQAADDSPAADPLTGSGLSPNTRQVIQVTIAGALAIVVGELLSPSHWYWALIATFVIYLGTSTRGQTLTKGWQLVVGTVIGVGVATLIASLVGGNVVASLALIFVALFTGSYLRVRHRPLRRRWFPHRYTAVPERGHAPPVRQRDA
jgi:hypothetical protein